MFQVMLDHPRLVLVPVQHLVSTHTCTIVAQWYNLLHNTDITDLDEVKRWLKNFADWLSLGLELGLYYNTLESIEKEECKDVEKCTTKMLAGWLQQQDKVTRKGVPCWATLEKALRNIDKNELANTIQKHYS